MCNCEARRPRNFGLADASAFRNLNTLAEVVCISMCIDIVSVCLSVFSCSVYVTVCMHLCMYVCMYVYMYVSLHIMYTHPIFVCICIYACICYSCLEIFTFFSSQCIKQVHKGHIYIYVLSLNC